MPRKIRRYVVDRGVIGLPFAIRSMTSLAAQIMGLNDRGVIRPGAWADLVVFDLASIADTATFTEPHQYPDRIALRVRERCGGGGRTGSSRRRRRGRSLRHRQTDGELRTRRSVAGKSYRTVSPSNGLPIDADGSSTVSSY